MEAGAKAGAKIQDRVIGWIGWIGLSRIGWIGLSMDRPWSLGGSHLGLGALGGSHLGLGALEDLTFKDFKNPKIPPTRHLPNFALSQIHSFTSKGQPLADSPRHSKSKASIQLTAI